MNQVLKINPDINITSARKVVDTRNFVIHAYDSLNPSILCGDSDKSPAKIEGRSLRVTLIA